jgi:hypothetical protein
MTKILKEKKYKKKLRFEQNEFFFCIKHFFIWILLNLFD